MKLPKIKLPENFSIKELFGSKKFNIGFSVITAFIVWLVIMINQNPEVDRTFVDVPVNINIDNTYVQENNMEIIGDLSLEKFTVVVRGPSYIVSSLKTSDFYVYASASAVNAPGEYKLSVVGASNSPLKDFSILSVSPSTVTVDFDYVDTKEFEVTAIAEGASAVEGLIAETPVVSGVESNVINIKGPRSVMNRIDRVEAYSLSNETLSNSKTYDAELRLYDSDNNRININNLTFDIDKVTVTVPISKKITVPVVAEFSNLPSGFDKNSISYTINHDSVTVIGKPDVIDKIKSVSLSAININSVSTGSNSFDVSAKLPEGVRLLDSIEHFTVSINTKGYSEKVFNISNIRYVGLADGLNATSDSIIKNVKICGPRSVINKLNSGQLYAEVNLQNKTDGEHTVVITIKSDKYNNIWQVGNYSTTVKISK